MKSIVVPVNFSEHSDNALYMAANIAKRENAKIHLVHMLGLSDAILPTDTTSLTADLIPYIKLIESKFEEMMNSPYLKGIAIDSTIRKTSVFNEITTISKDLDADLIVMGSGGASGLDELLIGSNTQKVVRNSEIPVMVIKNKMQGFDIQKAVFACDFDTENIGSFETAMQFFKTLDIDVHLVYINTPQDFKSSEEITTLVSQFFDQIPTDKNYPRKVKVFSDYDVEKGILHFCNAINAGIIGIPTHGRKGLSHVFAGSIGETIVNHSEIPVVTFKI